MRHDRPMTAFLFSLTTFFSTLGGGLLALRLRDRLHYVLGFAAGVLLGVVAFDLLPGIFTLAGVHRLDATPAMAMLVIGFLVFHGLEKFLLVHHAHEGDYAAHRHPRVGMLSAAALVGHSFMDGVSIGLAFQVSQAIGLAVAVAVIAHDFSDGLNTVSLMLRHGNRSGHTLAMLVLDAAAPMLGAASTAFLHVPPLGLMLYLGFFAGFLLYLSAADILPEAHSRAGPAAAMKLIGLTCLGAAFAFAAIRWSV